MSCFKNFDCYGSPFKFTVNKDRSFTSAYGGISSILVLLIFLTYASYILYDLFMLNNVKKDWSLHSFNFASIDFKTYGHFMVATCVTSEQNSTEYDKFADDGLEHTFAYSEVYKKPWLIQFDTNIPIK